MQVQRTFQGSRVVEGRLTLDAVRAVGELRRHDEAPTPARLDPDEPVVHALHRRLPEPDRDRQHDDAVVADVLGRQIACRVHDQTDPHDSTPLIDEAIGSAARRAADPSA